MNTSIIPRDVLERTSADQVVLVEARDDVRARSLVVSRRKVSVAVTLGHILNSPVYDAKRLDKSHLTAWSPIYGYHAVPSHWEAKYAYPALRHVDTDP